MVVNSNIELLRGVLSPAIHPQLWLGTMVVVVRDEEMVKRIVDEMWTADWWWDVQVSSESCTSSVDADLLLP